MSQFQLYSFLQKVLTKEVSKFVVRIDRALSFLRPLDNKFLNSFVSASQHSARDLPFITFCVQVQVCKSAGVIKMFVRAT